MHIKARDFAINAHGNQMYGAYPYSVHLDAVALIAKQYGETAETVAYLHAAVEDTEVTLEEIEKVFGSHISRCVAILTDEPGQTRK